MIESSKNPVKPEARLVYLTLVSSKEEERLQKISSSHTTSIAQQPSEAVTHVDHTDQSDTEMLDEVEAATKAVASTVNDAHNGGDSESPPTVVGDNEGTESNDDPKQFQTRAIENKENIPPMEMIAEDFLTHANSSVPTLDDQSTSERPATDTSNRSVVKSLDTDLAPQLDLLTTNGTSASTPHPERPPPIPPRPQNDEASLLKQAEETTRRQQDVTEAMGNVLDQLQCAIKAEAIDEVTNEQMDRIKGLFYGKQKTYLTDADGDLRTQESYMSDIKIYARKGSIYSALDYAIYGREVVDVGEGSGSSYTTITQLPPVLQIFVQRTGYVKGTGQFKVKDHLQLEETLYMDRYMDSSDKTDLQARHRKVWEWQKDLESLEDQFIDLKKPKVSSKSDWKPFC